MMKNIFDSAVSAETIERINKLTPETQPLWGKMNVAQAMAHCCVTYEFVYTDIHPKLGKFKQFLFKALVKKSYFTNKTFGIQLKKT